MNAKSIAYRVTVVVLLVLLAGTIACKSAAPSDGQTGKPSAPAEKGGLVFPDKAFEQAIRDLLGKYSGAIQPAEVLTIQQISGRASDIKDITGIENLTALNQIYLPENEIVDISPLSKLTQMTRIYLDGNKIQDISPLAGLVNLRVLTVGDAVTDISAVAGMTKLNNLTVHGPVSDISAVANLADLTTLDLENCQVSDLTPLSKLEKLTRLYLKNNPVSDLKPLVDNPKITAGIYVKLEGCPLSDKSVNEYIPELKKRGVIIQR